MYFMLLNFILNAAHFKYNAETSDRGITYSDLVEQCLLSHQSRFLGTQSKIPSAEYNIGVTQYTRGVLILHYLFPKCSSCPVERNVDDCHYLSTFGPVYTERQH